MNEYGTNGYRVNLMTSNQDCEQRQTHELFTSKVLQELHQKILADLRLAKPLFKIGSSGAHYYFCFNLSLIIESYLEYQYTPV